ncbi:glycosyltransferase family 2 protein [Treponema pedis]|uniref:glycosyltransferase family 2 protein n=1 Tax=Treponema pedis TaxID=409322 RepID=UPI00040B19DC|nr:glycosyltransferase family 2 protein [Treponema pedis]
MDTLFIVMPVYNEEENIESVIRQWYPILDGKNDKSKLVVADGGSKDKTLEILYNLQNKYTKLEVFSKPGTDHGTKLIFLYDYAINQNSDFIFQTDSDGQTDPTEFEAFWVERNKYDAIFGNRSDRKDGKIRVFVENVLRFVLWLNFGVKIPDANAPFRLIKTNLLKKYLYKLPADFNLPNALLCAYCSYFKENVSYKYISFKPRQAGVNYINIKRIIKIGWEAIGNFRILRKELNGNY